MCAVYFVSEYEGRGIDAHSSDAFRATGGGSGDILNRRCDGSVVGRGSDGYTCECRQRGNHEKKQQGRLLHGLILQLGFGQSGAMELRVNLQL